MTQDSESVVVPRVKEFVSQLTAALRVAYKANGGIAAIARRTHGAALIRNIATLEAAKVFEGLAAAPSTSVREEAITAAIAKADEDFGYRFNLTRMVNGEETHTLFMDGFEPVEFDDRDDGYRLIAERRNKARATAVLAALVPTTDEGKRR